MPTFGKLLFSADRLIKPNEKGRTVVQQPSA
jgi:hypothetical protein